MRELTVEVKVQPQSYGLCIGCDLFARLAADLRETRRGKRYAIISDDAVAPLWAESLAQALAAVGLQAEIFTFSAGEESKTRRTKEMLEDSLLAAGYGRDSVILALGGGVVGDVAGYVAATYMRGVPVVQIPTTTLSMADSSIGGKTGVDTPWGKNLIGAFHHPDAVYMDMRTLQTLDERNYRAGLTELVKHGFIKDPEILTFFLEHQDAVMERDPAVMEELFCLNCRVKNDVVAEDAQEAGLRQCLNYGHTLGHAVEVLSHFDMIHGECVALGIRFAAFLAERMGLADASWTARQNAVLDGLAMPRRIPDGIGTEDMIRVMLMDKKTRDGEIRFVITVGEGQVRWNVAVSAEELRGAIDAFKKM